MEERQNRVIVERDDLENKMQKLNKFMQTNQYQKLHHREAEILNRQYQAMDSYYKCLGNRITNFDLGE